MADETIVVDFWFDPVCPYSWIGSRWLLEVEHYRPVAIRWHILSLYLLNAHRTDDPAYVDYLLEVTGPARVASAAAVQFGDGVLRDLYTAFGVRIFDQWRHASGDECREAMRAALAETGLPSSLLNRFDETGIDDDLRRSHRAGLEPVGQPESVGCLEFVQVTEHVRWRRIVVCDAEKPECQAVEPLSRSLRDPGQRGDRRTDAHGALLSLPLGQAECR